MIHIIDNLIKVTITSSLLIVVVLILKKLFSKQISVSLHYYIWFVVIMRLVLISSVPCSISIANLIFNDRPTILDTKEYESIPNEVFGDSSYNLSEQLPASEKAINTDEETDDTVATVKSSLSIREILFTVWVLGMFLTCILYIVPNIRFRSKLKYAYRQTDTEWMKSYKDILVSMGIKADIKVFFMKGISSPSIFGLFKPVIILPLSFKEPINESTRYILYHELSHYKNKDLLVRTMLVLLQIVYWYNPLVWLAFRRIRQDQEIRCDYSVIKFIGLDKRKVYSSLLIDMIEKRIMPSPIAAFQFGNTKKVVTTRIMRILEFKRIAKAWSALVIFFMISMTVVFGTDQIVETEQVKSLVNNLLPTISDDFSTAPEINNTKPVTVEIPPISNDEVSPQNNDESLTTDLPSNDNTYDDVNNDLANSTEPVQNSNNVTDTGTSIVDDAYQYADAPEQTKVAVKEVVPQTTSSDSQSENIDNSSEDYDPDSLAANEKVIVKDYYNKEQTTGNESTSSDSTKVIVQNELGQ